MKKINRLLLITGICVFACITVTKAQWEPIGPYGGPILFTKETNDAIYAIGGLTSKTLYKSIDGANTWSIVNSTNLPIRSFYSFDILNNVMYISTYSADSGERVLKSTDGGVTWQDVYGIEGIVFAWAEKDNFLFAGTSNFGMYRSSDNGNTWQQINNGLTTAPQGMLAIKDIIVVGNDIFITYGENGIYKSSDNGNTWQFSGNGTLFYSDPQYGDFYVPFLTLEYYNNTIYAGGDWNFGVWKSEDNGNNWVITSYDTNNITTVDDLLVKDNVIFASSEYGDIYRSLDNGITWTSISANLDITKYSKKLFSVDNSIFLANHGGIYKTDDLGETWIRADKYIMLQQINISGILKHNGNYFVGSFTSGVFKTEDNFNTWQSKNNGLLPVNDVMEDFLRNIKSFEDTHLFAYNYISTDDGESWSISTAPENSVDNKWVRLGSDIFTVDTYTGVYKSSDNGVSWNKTDNLNVPAYYTLNTDGTKLFLTTHSTTLGLLYSTDGVSWSQANFAGLAVMNINSFIILNGVYIATISNFGQSGIYRSTDNGMNWVKVYDKFDQGKLKENEGKLYVIGKNLEEVDGEFVWIDRVMISNDLGLTWQIISFQLGDNLRHVTIEKDKIFVSAKSGTKIYFSNNNGNNWVDITGNIRNNTLIGTIDIIENYVYISTSNSVWRCNLSNFELPVQPSVISGNTNPCANSVQTYSVDNIQNVTYTWQVPNGWTIISGQGTNQITISPNSTAGTIIVTPSNLFGTGPSQTLLVTPVGNAPTQPENIFGNNTPCIGSTQNYSVTNQPNVTFDWNLPAGWTLVSGNGTNAIVVTVGTASGEISVTPSNACDVGLAQTFQVTPKTIPAQPVAINGDDQVCLNSIKTYTVPNVVGETYFWTVPEQWIILAGNNTNTIAVTVGASSGNITVTPSNECGEGQAQTLAVTSNTLPAQPSEIIGETNPLSGSTQVYSVVNTSGVNYLWTFPSDWVLTSGQNTNAVTFTIGDNSGIVTCTPQNMCGNGPSQSLNVTVQQNSISDISSNFKIYPNPAKSFVNIEFDYANQSTEIKVMNIDGKTIYKTNYNCLNGYYTETLDLSEYENGIYLIQISNDTQIFSKKLIINK